jgi:hypothetical protein
VKALVKLGAPVIAAAAAVGLLAGSASAATTTVHRDGPDGPLYDGDYQILNVGDIVFSSSIFNASCSSVDLRGTMSSSGTGTLDQAAVSGCESSLGPVEVEFLNLPYTDAQIDEAPAGSDADGVLRFDDPDLEIQATIAGSISCVYGFDSTITSLDFEIRNHDNPANTTGQLAGTMNGTTLARKSGSFLCPTGVTANGLGVAKGKVAPTDTTYDQRLYVTVTP